MIQVIQTKNSFLNIHIFDSNILPICIDEIKDQLLINPPIKVFGKDCIQHRSIGFCSNTSIGYNYSNQLAKSIKLPPNMIKLLELINNKFNANFNGILVNKYNNGYDYISKHSDDEKDLDPTGVISISYGAIRTFRIRNKLTKEITNIKINSNEIIHMGGDFQKDFTHEIPIEKKHYK